MYTPSVKTISIVSVIFVFALIAGCDATGPSQDEDSTGDVETQVQEALGSEVSDFQILEIDVGQVTDDLGSGETTVPVVTRDNEVVEVTYQSRPANLRPDSVDTGFLREGPETTEEVALPPEQSYLLGDPENPRRTGGLTILDDDRTMLRGLTRHSDFGVSYVQSVNHLLRTDDHPDLHVVYNAENTEEFDIGDGQFVSAESGAGDSDAKLDLDADESTGVILDGDVDFYNADPSTVWRRQESLLLGVKVTNEFVEPLTSERWRLDLNIAGQEVWVSGGPSTTDPDQLMNELEDPGYFLIHSLSEKEMHLFLVGYNVSSLAGRAGGIGTPNGGWGGGSGDNHLFSETIFSQHINRLILAHEVGHLIGGHHGHSITSECSGSMCGRSLMNPTITSGTEYFFSDNNDTEITEVINNTLP